MIIFSFLHTYAMYLLFIFITIGTYPTIWLNETFFKQLVVVYGACQILIAAVA